MIRKQTCLSVRLLPVLGHGPALVATLMMLVSIVSPANVSAADGEAAQARFQKLVPWLPDGWLPLDEVVAFEEAAHFVYLAGRSSASEESATGDGGRSTARIRLVLLRPNTLVVDVWPFAAKYRDIGKPVAIQVHDVPSGSDQKSTHAVCLYRSPAEQTAASMELEHDENDVCNIAITTSEGKLRLSLPLELTEPGRIAVQSAEGKTLLAKRHLAAGLLPLGPAGTRLMERWDSRYRGDSPPAWDKGLPSSHLKAAVESGAVKPGRAVVLGCGTGTNAIYLAKQGFDVTAIDIAPTALNLAEEKARKANVHVRWLLADVLAPPADLEPFDVVFDRGCYHGVRRGNAAGYVQALKRLSRPGSQVLILAGNANEAEHYGPPRVKEDELRGDFSSAFDFVWLKTVRFDSVDPQDQGALAWWVRLRRKAEAQR